MAASYLSPAQPRRVCRYLAASLAAMLILGAAPRLWAQAALNQRLNMQVNQSGRMFDANPSLYGGRYNYSRPMSPLMMGNPAASGILRRGMSLQIASPVSDPTAFRGPLGSDSLGSFMRDSVSVADTSDPLGSAPYVQPYYDPTRTVASVGFLRGFTPTTTGLTKPLDFRRDTRLTTAQDLTAQIVGLQPLPQPSLETTSGIFGVKTPPRLALPTESDVQLPWERWNQAANEGPATEDTRGLGLERLLNEKTKEQEQKPRDLSTPLDEVLRAELRPNVGTIDPRDQRATWAAGFDDQNKLRPGLIVPEPSQTGDQTQAETQRPLITDASLMPGYDVFTDLRMSLALADAPAAPWLHDIEDSMKQQPQLTQQLPEEAVKDPAAYIDELRRVPLKTFTGSGSSALNDEMLKAESLMDIGHYREAADRYGVAAMMDPTNPLPLIGRGHALLATGDYRSAALSLMRGLERFPDIAHFSIDLKSLMGSGEVIDMRRADILERLDQRESVELRFLLGYLEYHTGDHARGLADLDRAARDPRASAVIARYPTLLRENETARAPAKGTPPPATPAAPRSDVQNPPPNRPADASETLMIPPPVAAPPKEPDGQR